MKSSGGLLESSARTRGFPVRFTVCARRELPGTKSTGAAGGAKRKLHVYFTTHQPESGENTEYKAESGFVNVKNSGKPSKSGFFSICARFWSSLLITMVFSSLVLTSQL